MSLNNQVTVNALRYCDLTCLAQVLGIRHPTLIQIWIRDNKTPSKRKIQEMSEKHGIPSWKILTALQLRRSDKHKKLEANRAISEVTGQTFGGQKPRREVVLAR